MKRKSTQVKLNPDFCALFRIYILAKLDLVFVEYFDRKYFYVDPNKKKKKTETKKYIRSEIIVGNHYVVFIVSFRKFEFFRKSRILGTAQ